MSMNVLSHARRTSRREPWPSSRYRRVRDIRSAVTRRNRRRRNLIEPFLIADVLLRNAGQQALRMKEVDMRKLALPAAALLLALSATGYAAPKGGANTVNAGGASEFSPGDQMRDRAVPQKVPGVRRNFRQVIG